MRLLVAAVDFAQDCEDEQIPRALDAVTFAMEEAKATLAGVRTAEMLAASIERLKAAYAKRTASEVN